MVVLPPEIRFGSILLQKKLLDKVHRRFQEKSNLTDLYGS
jgi:hypothetical protein